MGDAIAYGAMGLSVFLMSWIALRVVPKTGTWQLALIAVGCAALAVGFFWAYQWAGYPVLAYIDGITFGLFTLQAALIIWLQRLAPPSGERQGTEAAAKPPVVE